MFRNEFFSELCEEGEIDFGGFVGLLFYGVDIVFFCG